MNNKKAVFNPIPGRWFSNLFQAGIIMYYKFNKMTDWFIQNIRLVLYLLGLLYVDTVHHDVIIETCPFDILSATAMKDFKN